MSMGTLAALFALLCLSLPQGSARPVSAQHQRQGDLDAALARASEVGDSVKVADRIRRGAHVSALTPLGQTPLELAVEYGHLAAAQVLLSHRANANWASSFGSPLAWACERGDVGLVRLLLEHGADVRRENNHVSALLTTVACIAGAQVQSSDPINFRVSVSPNMRANRRLAEQMARKTAEQVSLLSGDTAPGARERRQAHGLEIMRLLMAHGVDVNLKDDSGETPLITAAQVGSMSAAGLLLESGAHIDAHDENGITALMHAAMMNHVDVLKFLILHGANVNTQNRDGWTSLFWAVSNLNNQAVKFLLEHGADVRLKTKNGLTVLNLAKQRTNPTILLLLEQAWANE